ncbi:MAG: hypothetical protein HQK76_14170 [Desulfobacterales bacterium]|nr:hypothetical protein [Desulfobacterales bacterium]
MVKKTIITLILFALIGSFYSSVVFASSTVEVTGTGITKEDAIKDGLRIAVEEILGVYLVSKSQVKDAVIQYDIITTESAGFVESYKVLSTTKKEDFFECFLKVDLVRDEKKILKILREILGKRTISIAITESIEKSDYKGDFLEQGVTSALISRRYYIVKPSFQPTYWIKGYAKGIEARSQLSDKSFKVVELMDMNISITDNYGTTVASINTLNIKRCVGSGNNLDEAGRDFFKCLSVKTSEKISQEFTK